MICVSHEKIIVCKGVKFNFSFRYCFASCMILLFFSFFFSIFTLVLKGHIKNTKKENRLCSITVIVLDFVQRSSAFVCFCGACFRKQHNKSNFI